jgi:hypothetical protein
MSHFDGNIRSIKEELNELPDFTDNFYSESLGMIEITEKMNALERICEEMKSTIAVLEDLKEAYHRYQEMYFDNLEEK